MSFILLEQRKILFDEIAFSINEMNWSPYSKQILNFCASWLQGGNTFEISTSGSTGIPQKIIWTRDLMLWSILNTAAALHLKKGMHCLHCIDAEKAGGKMMLARALQLGMSLEIVEPASNPFSNSVSTHYHFAAMVPLQIHQLWSENKLNALDKVDTLILGGASLNNSLKEVLQKTNSKVFATYGMTETASHIALQRINGEEKQECFKPFKDVEITMDEEHCAIISTPFHKKLQSNDIIHLNSDGSFIFIGRKDHTVNSGGFKIYMEKVEEAIDITLTHLKINFFNYCAYKKPDEKWGEALIVIFETDPWDEKTLEDFKEELKIHLHKYEMPKRFYFTNKLSYTSSGKIDRKKSAEIVTD